MSVDPDRADAYAILGAADWLDGRLVDSTRQLRRALQAEPLHYGASLGLARNLRARGDVSGSRLLLEALVADDPQQIDPRLGLMAGAWIAGDFDALLKVARQTLPKIHPDALELPLASHLLSLAKILAGVGPWCVVRGERGAVPIAPDGDPSSPIGNAKVNGTPIRVSPFWGPYLAVVNRQWVEEQEIDVRGAVQWPSDTPSSVVVIPRIEFGDIALERVPAIVESDRSALRDAGIDLVLGRHALTALGSTRVDVSSKTLVFSRVPTNPESNAAIVAPLFLLSGVGALPGISNTAATLIRGTEDGPDLAVYIGAYPGALTITDASRALGAPSPKEAKEFQVPRMFLAGQDLGPQRSIMLGAEQHDATVESVRELTGVGLVGSLSPSMLEAWDVTYVWSSGTLVLEPR